MIDKEATDITLFVRTSHEEVVQWDRRRIVNALVLEANLDPETSETISREVEKEVFSSGISTLTAPLIRELVNAKLIEKGFEEVRRLHTRLGFPLYDIERLITNRNKENANVPHWPEGTNLTLAEGIKKEFALHSVYSRDVADAHLSGDIHLHKLGFIDRPYSSSQSLEYVKKFGISLPGSPSGARPAKHADVLLAHMIRFSAALQGNFAAAIEWDAVNYSFAPYLENRDDSEIRQLAQRLVYEFAQPAFSRGGQTMFTDINLYWDVPPHLQGVPIIGPGGKVTGKGFGDYSGDAQRFLCALLRVFREGDAIGRPFFFPRPIIHITENLFSCSGWRDFLREACETAAVKGNLNFIFDRGNESRIASFYRVPLEAGPRPSEPWKTRHDSIGTVTLNLPRIGYLAEGSHERLFSILAERIDLAVKAQIQKLDFIKRLLSDGSEGPLSFLVMNQDGYPYLRMDQTVYPLGMVGLNEIVRIHTGKQLHESEKAMDFGLKILDELKGRVGELGDKHSMRFILEQTPSESTSYRFARLDLKAHSPKAGRFIRGDIAKGEIYYTNSTHLSATADILPIKRIRMEGSFHPYIEGAVNTGIRLTEWTPDKEDLVRLVETTFRETTCDQISFLPEFTSCASCRKTFRGLMDCCPFCGTDAVEKITRITGYFARVSDLNKGKLSELKEKVRYFLKPT